MNLHCAISGQGPNVVLLHGWSAHGGVWRNIVDALSDDFCLHTFDLPGHGHSPYTSDAFALDILVDALAAASPPSVMLVGWSLGGTLALHWAYKYPKQVSRLCLIGSTPCYATRSDWTSATPAVQLEEFSAQVAATPEQMRQRFGDLLCEGEADVRGALRNVRSALQSAPAPTTIAMLAGLEFLAKVDLRTERVEQPVLLIHGEGDTITPPAASLWLSTALPNAHLLLLQGCGHVPHLTHSTKVAAALNTFLHE